MWGWLLSALRQTAKVLGWVLLSVLSVFWVIGCVADSTGRMVTKCLVCLRLVWKGCDTQYCERSVLPVVRAAQVLGELLHQKHSLGSPLLLFFLGQSVILLCLWDACLSSEWKWTRVPTTAELVILIVWCLIRVFCSMSRHWHLHASRANGREVRKVRTFRERTSWSNVIEVVACFAGICFSRGNRRGRAQRWS